MMVQFFRQIVLLAMCGLVVSTMGCSSLTNQRRTTIKQATESNPAVRCLCVWQQAEGPGINGEISRGFSGQLFFFPLKGEIPVAIQGEMKIFLFDDIGSNEEQAKPLHQVDIPSFELAARLGETQFGPSYNVFVPYTRNGSQEANCALRVKLTRPDGSVLFSDMTQMRLAGSTRHKPVASTSTDIPLSETTSNSPMTSSTIAIERNGQFQRVETSRLRYLGDARPGVEFGVQDPQELVREYEAKLNALRSSIQSEVPAESDQ